MKKVSRGRLRERESEKDGKTTVFLVHFTDYVVITRCEATPCGDGVFKGVKVAWPGSGGQREEFPLRSAFDAIDSCVFASARIHTYIHARSHLACAFCDAPPP